ncbi:uncharacterized protein Z519_12191 [Cladophialophora bantiana CBS 173.52]|uniref:Major facilitator superfamily (MFS) profile domain-containing protein n=1 Tax=Cladophialophora bantiana (strain ATCC 10958 / CBS 173.52 / CDC B-1940 / NIH 8579) TaxID=1442370 RepID=A0A0D2H1X4_CLAB1|nr:uncharacterized protein Z519_12191 [Cladophialophora bantiana CBS 173.52]KIW87288.1 hypothetical protein Z519_12191 [Cladophialophora bantiana CBS 173.52]
MVFFLPNYPSEVKWLSQDETTFSIDRIAEQRSGFMREPASRREILDTCVGFRMLTHYLAYGYRFGELTDSSIYFTKVVIVSSIVYFCTTIVVGLGYSSIQARLMTVVPLTLGYVVFLIFAWGVDHFNDRGWFITVASTISGISFVVINVLPVHQYSGRFARLIIACCGCFPNTAALTAWVICNVPSPRAMGLAAAMNNMTVGASSTVAVWIWKASEAERGYPTGNIICAVFILLPRH